jgi:hypothetical protein
MGYEPLPRAVDPELGPVKLCRMCGEWWPDDAEFFKPYNPYRCYACLLEDIRKRHRQRKTA